MVLGELESEQPGSPGRSGRSLSRNAIAQRASTRAAPPPSYASAESPGARCSACGKALVRSGHLFAGITNRGLRELIARLIPGYGAGADDLRLAASARQLFHPEHPPQPRIGADQRGIPTGRLLHHDLHANRQPIPRRPRPHPPRRDRQPHRHRPNLASLRTRTQRQNRGRRPHCLKR
jgi:hypothetical protein